MTLCNIILCRMLVTSSVHHLEYEGIHGGYKVGHRSMHRHFKAYKASDGCTRPGNWGLDLYDVDSSYVLLSLPV